MNHYESLIPLDVTTVKSCRCYEQYWKTMKKLAFPYIEFNYSIEKTFSFRKYFYHQNLLYHFCISCFRPKSMLLSDCCPICVNYIIEHYSVMFFRTI